MLQSARDVACRSIALHFFSSFHNILSTVAIPSKRSFSHYLSSSKMDLQPWQLSAVAFYYWKTLMKLLHPIIERLNRSMGTEPSFCLHEDFVTTYKPSLCSDPELLQMLSAESKEQQSEAKEGKEHQPQGRFSLPDPYDPSRSLPRYILKKEAHTTST